MEDSSGKNAKKINSTFNTFVGLKDIFKDEYSNELLPHQKFKKTKQILKSKQSKKK